MLSISLPPPLSSHPINLHIRVSSNDARQRAPFEGADAQLSYPIVSELVLLLSPAEFPVCGGEAQREEGDARANVSEVVVLQEREVGCRMCARARGGFVTGAAVAVLEPPQTNEAERNWAVTIC